MAALENNYTTKLKKVVTSISGGREHFPYRQPVRSEDKYDYIIKFGDNYHLLANVVFGTDSSWWALYDLNLPKEGFSLDVGDSIKLPYSLVRNEANQTNIF